ncbi:MAG: SH3 domain-containing protein [Flavobacterium sp.]
MKIRLSIIIFILCNLLYAQENRFINSDTKLYTSKSNATKFLGYFGYGAQIQIISQDNDGWSKIKSDNLSEGYVQTKFISERLNASNVHPIDPKNPIIRADSYYGNNHLFVMTASVKARVLPDKTSKARQILSTGDPVAVNYCPANTEEWVNISGSFDTELVTYIQRKHLGKRPVFDEMVKEFDKLATFNIAERKTVSERLVELAWNSDPKTLLPAYDRYYYVTKQLQNEKLIADTEMYMTLAKGLVNHKSSEEVKAFLKNAAFVIDNISFKDFKISQKELVQHFGKPTEIKTISDECGVYLSDTFYYYPDFEIAVDEKKNNAELVKVYLNEHTKFVINSSAVLDHTLSEKDFITKYATYIGKQKTPHIYLFPIEDGSYIVAFRDGKIYSIEIAYSC